MNLNFQIEHPLHSRKAEQKCRKQESRSLTVDSWLARIGQRVLWFHWATPKSTGWLECCIWHYRSQSTRLWIFRWVFKDWVRCAGNVCCFTKSDDSFGIRPILHSRWWLGFHLRIYDCYSISTKCFRISQQYVYGVQFSKWCIENHNCVQLSVILCWKGARRLPFPIWREVFKFNSGIRIHASSVNQTGHHW